MCVANIVFSQSNQLTIGAELRPRFILNDGYTKPLTEDQDPYGYITQRTRLYTTFVQDNLSANVSFQDVRTWGDDDRYNSTRISGNTASVSLFEGWFKYDLKKNLFIKIGRQLLSCDDQRIVSTRGWNDYQVTYDALLMKWTLPNDKVDLALSWNANNTKNKYYSPEKFRLFSYLRYEKQLGDFNFSGIAIFTGNTLTDTTTDIFYRGTYGLYARYKKNKFHAIVSGYYQNNLNDVGVTTDAFCFSVLLKQKFPDINSELAIGADYLSGQDETKEGSYQNTNHRFDILYGKRHGFYGYMDYFSTTPLQGLQDYYAKFNYSFFKKYSLGVDYHYFKLAANLFKSGLSTEMQKNLGQELDLTFKAEIVKNFDLQAGYSFFLATDTYKQISNLENQNLRFPQFFYLMVTIKPSFIF